MMTAKNCSHILVVDDSLTVRMALQDVFSKQDYEVSLAGSAEECFEALCTETIDVVILDLVMEGTSGVDVLRKLKGDAKLAHIPVLLLTAVADRKELVACLAIGAEDFIVKPWDERELLGRVRSMVRLKRALDQARFSAARTQALLNVPLLMAVLIDRNGVVQACNELAARIFQTSVPRFVGQSFFDSLPEEPKTICLSHIQSVLETGEPVRFENTWGDRILDSSIYPVAESEKCITGCAILAMDVTERKRAEAELESANRRLVDASRQAGRAEIATNVLHNVGNILNSVNVSANLLSDMIRQFGVADLCRVVELLDEHQDDLGNFVTQHERGQFLAPFLQELSRSMTEQEKKVRDEISLIQQNVEQINNVMALQETLAGTHSVVESALLSEIAEAAIQLNEALISEHAIECDRDIEPIPEVQVDRCRLQQVLFNLIQNAAQAVAEADEGQPKRIVIRLRRHGDSSVRFQVEDSGVGIAAEDRTRVFALGYTTRQGAQGYGLHSAALMAQELGGSLTAHSEGPGTGACLTLEFPASLTPSKRSNPIHTAADHIEPFVEDASKSVVSAAATAEKCSICV